MVEIIKLAYENPATTCLFLLVIGMIMPTLRFERTRKKTNDTPDKNKDTGNNGPDKNKGMDT